jgi:hypothetical protein
VSDELITHAVVRDERALMKMALKTQTGELAWWLFMSIAAGGALSVIGAILGVSGKEVWPAIALSLLISAVAGLLAFFLSRAALSLVRMHCFASRLLPLDLEHDVAQAIAEAGLDQDMDADAPAPTD